MHVAVRSVPVFACLLLVGAFVAPASTASHSTFPIPNGPGTPVADAVDFLRSMQAPDGSVGGIAISAWVAMAAVHAGEDPAAWRTDEGAPSLTTYLVASGQAQLATMLTTDVARHMLALATAGVDVRDAGGADYVAALLADFDGTQLGDADLMHDDYFGMLALHAAGAAPDTVATLREWVLANQMPDGGWSWRSLATTDPFSIAFGPTSDVDSTAAAIWSLLAAGVPADGLAVTQGLAFIKTHQYVDGGHGNSVLFDTAFSTPLESNTGSTSWAIGAITASGGDPQGLPWTTAGGADPVDFLVSMQADDGSFRWTSSNPGGFVAGTDLWMTAFAVTALTGSTYLLG